MRIKRTLYNIIVAIGSYALIAVVAVILRKFFLQYLPTEYLGYEGLFSDLFAILSIADLGIHSIILYKMYPAIESGDEALISKLMSVYKLLYRIVGTGIAAVGLLLIPFLHFIIKDNTLEWSYVYMVYILQLVVALCAYFLAYKRVMFVATMRESEATKIETACTLSSHLIKIAVILLTKNYIAYLLVGVANNIISNALIAKSVNKQYPYVAKSTKITRQDIQELGIGHDLGNNFIQKICTAIYGGTDGILISALIGIKAVGLLTNYSLITGYVTTLAGKLLSPFQVSIGNFVHSKDENDISRKNEMFHMFDRMSFFIASFISVSFFVLFNPFIEFVFGAEFLLGSLYVLFFSVNQYIAYNHKFLYFYRSAFGKFELDKWYTALAAVLNIALSIILSKPLGIAGIMLGTVIGHMGFWVGRVLVVYKEYMTESSLIYIRNQIVNLLLWALEMGLTYYLSTFLPISLLGIAGRIGLVLIIPNAINFLVFLPTRSMKMIFEYIKKSKKTILK